MPKSGGVWRRDRHYARGLRSQRPYGSTVRLPGIKTVSLSWPNLSIGYVLQQTGNMSGPGGDWTDVIQAPVINGANKEFTLQATGQFCLFRLRGL